MFRFSDIHKRERLDNEKLSRDGSITTEEVLRSASRTVELANLMLLGGGHGGACRDKKQG